MEKFYYASEEQGLSREEIRAALLDSLEGRMLKNVLIIPPDFTRFHSNAGYITNVYYHVTDFMFFFLTGYLDFWSNCKQNNQ